MGNLFDSVSDTPINAPGAADEHQHLVDTREQVTSLLAELEGCNRELQRASDEHELLVEAREQIQTLQAQVQTLLVELGDRQRLHQQTPGVFEHAVGGSTSIPPVRSSHDRAVLRGIARRDRLSSDRRQEIARQAAHARWARKRAGLVTLQHD